MSHGARLCVSFAEGEDDSLPPVFDESDIDSLGHSGGPRDDTVGATRSGGGSRAPELSSGLLDSLQHAGDPIMQRLGSFLSAFVAKTVDLR